MNQVKLFIELTRLTKPIGFMLLFWPCAWGLTLAYDFSNSLNKYFFYLILFFLGSVLMRSAGCIVNDILDKEFDAKVLIDGAQGCVNDLVDVKKIDCDFYVFSGHKALGPTGIGVLYGKQKLLEEMPPWQGGGDMIKKVSFEHTTYNEIPYKFEAGTPNISGAIGLSEALNYLSTIGLSKIISHEKKLLDIATERAQNIPGLRIIGNAKNKTSIISFVIDNLHPQDIGTLLDQQGVAIRAGHHCVMPLMDRFGLDGTARASFCLYNNEEDVNKVFDAVETATKLLN